MNKPSMPVPDLEASLSGILVPRHLMNSFHLSNNCNTNYIHSIRFIQSSTTQTAHHQTHTNQPASQQPKNPKASSDHITTFHQSVVMTLLSNKR